MLIFAVLVLFNTQRLLSNAYKRLLKIGNKQHVYKRFQFLIGTFIRFTCTGPRKQFGFYWRTL